MMDDLVKYYLMIEAKETTAGEVLGAVLGACIACCVCIALGAFLKKKMTEKSDDAVNQFGENDHEMEKLPPATPPPQMGQPQQQMYGQQPMMQQPQYGQQPMGMGMQQ